MTKSGTARQFIKKLLPSEFRRDLRTLGSKIELFTLKMLSRSRWGAALYYLIFSSSFAREQQAVLSGRLRYRELLTEASGNRYQLRRNIHRLEKGLVMQPRRDVFALSYIDQTVLLYQKAVLDPDSENAGVQWAHDVLTAYFEVVAPIPRLSSARRIFAETESASQDSGASVPYRRDLNATSVSYEDMRQLAYKRRSVRWFKPQKIPRELLDKALEIAILSPSACNRQPFTFRIFDTPEVVERIASLPMGTQGFYQNIPAIVAIVGELSAYETEQDRHVIYIDASLAAMSFMFALETLSLSSCPINWPDVESLERQMDDVLALKPEERPIMLMAVGFPDPDGLVPYSQKRSISELRSYNELWRK